MIVSFLILLVGFEVFSDSLSKLITPDPTAKSEFSILTLVILGVSVLTKVALGLYYRAVGNRIDSAALKASGVDSLSDSVSTLAVLVSSIIIKLTDLYIIDAIVGLAVSLLIFVAGIKVLNETKNSILGEAPVKETVEELEAIVARHPEIIGIHDMMVHNYGPRNLVASFHAEVDGEGDIFYLHDVIDNVEPTYTQMLDAIEGKAPLTITPEQALRVVKVMEAAFESAKLNQVIHTDI
jgi:cation diffusion facilitator family transporter